MFIGVTGGTRGPLTDTPVDLVPAKALNLGLERRDSQVGDTLCFTSLGCRVGSRLSLHVYKALSISGRFRNPLFRTLIFCRDMSIRA